MSRRRRWLIGIGGAVLLASTLAAIGLPASAGWVRSLTLAATVAADGTLLGGNGATAATRVGTGSYEVEFDEAVDGCSAVATINEPSPGDPKAAGTIYVAGGTSGTKAVAVQTKSAGGGLADYPFSVQVRCGDSGIWAVIDADGSIVRKSTRVQSVSITHCCGYGDYYEIRVANDQLGCSPIATIGNPDTTPVPGVGLIQAVASTADPTLFTVAITEDDGWDGFNQGGVRRAFHLQIWCPSIIDNYPEGDFAVVRLTGTVSNPGAQLSSSSNYVTGVTRVDKGIYDLDFRYPVYQSNVVVTPFQGFPAVLATPYFLHAWADPAAPNRLRVQMVLLRTYQVNTHWYDKWDAWGFSVHTVRAPKYVDPPKWPPFPERKYPDACTLEFPCPDLHHGPFTFPLPQDCPPIPYPWEPANETAGRLGEFLAGSAPGLSFEVRGLPMPICGDPRLRTVFQATALLRDGDRTVAAVGLQLVPTYLKEDQLAKLADRTWYGPYGQFVTLTDTNKGGRFVTVSALKGDTLATVTLRLAEGYDKLPLSVDALIGLATADQTTLFPGEWPKK